MAWQVIGHDWAVTLLRQSLAAGRVAHACLFSGPPQIGKTTLALTLAQALNCTRPDSPCGQCPSCLKIARHLHPDVQLIVGQGAGGSIKIDQIRALQREATLAPYEGRYRVFVLRRMDQATIEAANSLLKTLEEPPAHVVLGLTSVHTEAMPATVVSRCQRLDLRPIAYHDVETALHEKGLPPPRARLLARLSGGRLGWAFDACADETVLQQRQQDLDQFIQLLSADRVERFEFARQASQDATAGRRRIELWTGWWRDLLLLCTHGEDHIVNVDRIEELRMLAGQWSPTHAWACLEALQTAAAQLKSNVNAQLVWESFLLKLPRLYRPSQARAF
jgi:DNA polymerase-3 subunit delta'